MNESFGHNYRDLVHFITFDRYVAWTPDRRDEGSSPQFTLIHRAKGPRMSWRIPQSMGWHSWSAWVKLVIGVGGKVFELNPPTPSPP